MERDSRRKGKARRREDKEKGNQNSEQDETTG